MVEQVLDAVVSIITRGFSSGEESNFSRQKYGRQMTKSLLPTNPKAGLAKDPESKITFFHQVCRWNPPS